MLTCPICNSPNLRTSYKVLSILSKPIIHEFQDQQWWRQLTNFSSIRSALQLTLFQTNAISSGDANWPVFFFVLKSNTVSAPFLQALSVEYKYEKICLLVLAIWGEVWGKNPIQHRQEIKLSVPRFAVKTARKRPAEKIVCKTFKNLWDVHKQRSWKQKIGLNRLGNKVSSSWKYTRNKITAISRNFNR